MELYERIRQDHARGVEGIRRLAREHRCHRREVRQALASAVPAPRRQTARARPVLGPWLDAIDAMLAADRKAPRKQRHTAHRIWVRLTEMGATVAEITVRQYVHKRRRELYGVTEVMVPQHHEPGREAEVDLSESVVEFPDACEKVFFFHMRACRSGKTIHWPLHSLTQQAFLEAHTIAFEHFGGVFDVVRYDNLKLAVRKVLRGRNRLECDRFVLLRSHYQFTAEFCQPGLRGAHEKGGVEGEIGYFRRNYLVPIPKVGDWHHLIDLCAFAYGDEEKRHLDGRVASIAELWEEERTTLRPLPAERFDTAIPTSGRVDPKGRVNILRNRYSVPVSLVGLIVEGKVTSGMVVLSHKGKEVGRHQRAYGIGADRLELDHYLEVLRYKPRALAGSIPLRQAIADGTFPIPYIKLYEEMERRHGRSEGARQMVDLLFLHRQYGAPAVLMAVEEALAAGTYDFAAVALILRRAAEPPPVTTRPSLQLIHEPLVPIPDCRQYDQLLKKGKNK